MQSLSHTASLLKKHGIRPSLQRIAVMDYLATHRTHPTADEIYAALAPQIPTLSKTTVYNTLALLVRQGAATQLHIDPREARFDGDTAPHGHFYCEECGTLYDIPFSAPPAVPVLPQGYLLRATQLYYRGVCAACTPLPERHQERTHITVTQ